MRTTVKILSIFAAAACAVGLSACEDEVMQQGTGAPAAEAAAGQQDQQSGGEQGAGATDLIGARPIEPITFNDETVGLTETCDAIHSDYAAPSYKAQASDPAETVYLLHCTLDFSGGSSFGPETDRSLTLIDDGNVYRQGYVNRPDSFAEDFERSGIRPITDDDYGSTHVEGWYVFTVPGENGLTSPIPDEALSLAYERNLRVGKGPEPTYDTYFTQEKVTFING